ncbi:hypothetical protein IFM89_003445 [Coptis chinensis]|uniref:Uncharacterized protein n=1 Tax=Coptis chinensis TaxID=261450 RepID=A0A835LHG1_9MAGN|nr:hypothetical protein IFM89_003445 [Coptis chinensis]
MSGRFSFFFFFFFKTFQWQQARIHLETIKKNNGSNNYNGHNGVVNGGNKSSSENHPHPAPPPRALKHSPEPGLSSKWTSEEQTILDEGLIKYASEIPMARYTMIAASLHDKNSTLMSALRCRWMTKKESGKRRKEDMSRKSKDKKERTTDPSVKSSAHLAIRPSVPPYAPPMIPVDNDDGISYQAIGGPTGHLLEQNAQVFEQISANFATLQIHDVHKNINLFCQTRDNILTIMNEGTTATSPLQIFWDRVCPCLIDYIPHDCSSTMKLQVTSFCYVLQADNQSLNVQLQGEYSKCSSLNDMPGIMKQMPPLPVKVNEELANTILPRPTRPMQS